MSELHASEYQGTRAAVGVLDDALDDLVANVLNAWEASQSPPAAGDAVPDSRTVARACRWITRLFTEARQANTRWFAPHVVANPVGNIVFEWRNDIRLLTVYVTPQATEFVQAWGTNMDTEMRDGEADSAATRQELWSWLIGQ
jgi:hypothetical protein